MALALDAQPLVWAGGGFVEAKLAARESEIEAREQEVEARERGWDLHDEALKLANEKAAIWEEYAKRRQADLDQLHPVLDEKSAAVEEALEEARGERGALQKSKAAEQKLSTQLESLKEQQEETRARRDAKEAELQKAQQDAKAEAVTLQRRLQAAELSAHLEQRVSAPRVPWRPSLRQGAH